MATRGRGVVASVCVTALPPAPPLAESRKDWPTLTGGAERWDTGWSRPRLSAADGLKDALWLLTAPSSGGRRSGLPVIGAVVACGIPRRRVHGNCAEQTCLWRILYRKHVFVFICLFPNRPAVHDSVLCNVAKPPRELANTYGTNTLRARTPKR